MSDKILDTVVEKLGLSEELYELTDVSSTEIHFPSKKKRVWNIKTKDKKINLYILLHPVSKQENWYQKNLKFATEVLSMLNLRYSSCPNVIAYFRVKDEKEICDVAVLQGENANLLLQFYRGNKTDMLNKLPRILSGLGRAYAELHSKKLQLRKKPKMLYFQSYQYWIDDFKSNFSKLKLSKPLDFYLDKLHHCHEEAFSHPFLTGIIHYDPGPHNVMYNPINQKFILLDLEPLSYSIDKKGDGVGPVALDYIKLYNAYRGDYSTTNLPKDCIANFTESYKAYCKENFPHDAHLLYFQVLEHIKALCVLSKEEIHKIQAEDSIREQLERMISTKQLHGIF